MNDIVVVNEIKDEAKKQCWQLWVGIAGAISFAVIAFFVIVWCVGAYKRRKFARDEWDLVDKDKEGSSAQKLNDDINYKGQEIQPLLANFMGNMIAVTHALYHIVDAPRPPHSIPTGGYESAMLRRYYTSLQSWQVESVQIDLEELSKIMVLPCYFCSLVENDKNMCQHQLREPNPVFNLVAQVRDLEKAQPELYNSFMQFYFSKAKPFIETLANVTVSMHNELKNTQSYTTISLPQESAAQLNSDFWGLMGQAVQDHSASYAMRNVSAFSFAFKKMKPIETKTDETEAKVVGKGSAIK